MPNDQPVSPSWIIGAAVVNAFYSPNRNQIGTFTPRRLPHPSSAEGGLAVSTPHPSSWGHPQPALGSAKEATLPPAGTCPPACDQGGRVSGEAAETPSLKAAWKGGDTLASVRALHTPALPRFEPQLSSVK